MKKFDIEDFYEWYNPNILYDTMEEFICSYNKLVEKVEKLESEIEKLKKGGYNEK